MWLVPEGGSKLLPADHCGATQIAQISEFMKISKAWLRKDALPTSSTRRYMGQLRNMKRNRALDAAARFLRTLPSQVLLQPRVGRSAYERAKRCKCPIMLSDRREQYGRRAPGRSANQIAARRPGLVHAATALGAECPQPPGDCWHDHVRRPVPRPPWLGRSRGCVARLPVRDVDPTHRGERHGWRRFVRNCPRARCRQARCRRRACPAHVCSGPWFSTVLLLGAPFVFRWMGGMAK